MRPSPAAWVDVLEYRRKRASYWTNDGRMSPGLLRAREPFRVRNAITGAIVLSFAVGVYYYSISAVKQDDFSDVPMPSPEQMKRIEEQMEQERAPGRTGGGAAVGGGAVQGGPAAAGGMTPTTAALTRPEGAELPSMGILGSVAFLSGRAPAAAPAGSRPMSAAPGGVKAMSSTSPPPEAIPTPTAPAARGLVQGAPSLDRLGSTREQSALARGDRRIV